MGFSLKKLARGALKLGKKLAPSIIAATPLAGIALRAQQVAKSLAVNPRSARVKPEPLSVQAAIAKPAVGMMTSAPGPRRRIDLRPARMTSRGAAYQTPADMRSAGGLTRAQKTGRTGFQKAKRASGKGRTPPRGGLDLKAIAAEWRRQGKPGTWLGFIKANSNIRK